MDLRIPATLIALLTAAPAFAQTKQMTGTPMETMGATPVPGAPGSASAGLGGGLSAPGLDTTLDGIPTAPTPTDSNGQPLAPPVVEEAPAATQEASADVQVVPPSPQDEHKEDADDGDGDGFSWWQVALIALAVFGVSRILFGKRERR
jgi:hypothetical protein